MHANRLCLDNCLAVPGCLVHFHLLLLVLLHSFSFLILNPFFQEKITLKKAAVSKLVFIASVQPLRCGKLMSVCVVCFLFFLSPWLNYFCTTAAVEMKINSLNAGPETGCCT